MRRNKKIDSELRKNLNMLTEINSNVAENTGHINEKLDDIKIVLKELNESNHNITENTRYIREDTETIKKGTATKVSIVVAVISLVATIIIAWISKSETNNAIDESQNVQKMQNNNTGSDTDDFPNMDEVESDNEESDFNEFLNTDQMEEDLAYQKVIDFEKNKFWEDKNIVGIPYEPDLDVLKWITDTVDYIDNWDAYEPAALYHGEGSEGEKAAIVGKTENFLIYDICMNEGSMLIKTFEDSYILIDNIPSTTLNTKVQPLFIEADYDDDGNNELAIRILQRGGTGYSVDSLFMVDKISNGQWYVFQFVIDDFIYTIQKNYSRKIIDDKVYFVWDGNVIDIPEKYVDDMYYKQYCVGNIVSIDICPEEIGIKWEVGYGFDPLIDYSSGHGISAKVLYLKEGMWEMQGYSYYNDTLERYVTRIMELYLTGDVEALSQECDFDLPASTQIAAEYDIVEIQYDSSKFGSDTFKVYIKYVIGQSDITHHATFTVKQMYSADMWDDIWKICGFDIIK